MQHSLKSRISRLEGRQSHHRQIVCRVRHGRTEEDFAEAMHNAGLEVREEDMHVLLAYHYEGDGEMADFMPQVLSATNVRAAH